MWRNVVPALFPRTPSFGSNCDGIIVFKILSLAWAYIFSFKLILSLLLYLIIFAIAYVTDQN